MLFISSALDSDACPRSVHKEALVDQPREETLNLEALRGFAQAAGIDHDNQRLAELAPQLAQQFRDLAGLWKIDVAGYEMAITFSATE